MKNLFKSASCGNPAKFIFLNKVRQKEVVEHSEEIKPLKINPVKKKILETINSKAIENMVLNKGNEIYEKLLLDFFNYNPEYEAGNLTKLMFRLNSLKDKKVLLENKYKYRGKTNALGVALNGQAQKDFVVTWDVFSDEVGEWFILALINEKEKTKIEVTIESTGKGRFVEFSTSGDQKTLRENTWEEAEEQMADEIANIKALF